MIILIFCHNGAVLEIWLRIWVHFVPGPFLLPSIRLHHCTKMTTTITKMTRAMLITTCWSSPLLPTKSSPAAAEKLPPSTTLLHHHGTMQSTIERVSLQFFLYKVALVIAMDRHKVHCFSWCLQKVSRTCMLKVGQIQMLFSWPNLVSVLLCKLLNWY